MTDNIANKTLITLKQAAQILGLKYHTARNILYNDNTIGCVDYGSKKLWVEDDILNFKCKHYVAPKVS